MGKEMITDENSPLVNQNGEPAPPETPNKFQVQLKSTTKINVITKTVQNNKTTKANVKKYNDGGKTTTKVENENITYSRNVTTNSDATVSKPIKMKTVYTTKSTNGTNSTTNGIATSTIVNPVLTLIKMKIAYNTKSRNGSSNITNVMSSRATPVHLWILIGAACLLLASVIGGLFLYQKIKRFATCLSLL